MPPMVAAKVKPLLSMRLGCFIVSLVLNVF